MLATMMALKSQQPSRHCGAKAGACPLAHTVADLELSFNPFLRLGEGVSFFQHTFVQILFSLVH